MSKQTQRDSYERDLRRKRIKIGVAVALLIVAGVLAWLQLSGESRAESAAGRRIFKCSECGQTFYHTLKEGEAQPIACEHCGKRTAYRPEACYWAKAANGQWTSKEEPTYVILRIWTHPGERTYCPDCGHEVWGHFPRPTPEDIERENRKGEHQNEEEE